MFFERPFCSGTFSLCSYRSRFRCLHACKHRRHGTGPWVFGIGHSMVIGYLGLGHFFRNSLFDIDSSFGFRNSSFAVFSIAYLPIAYLPIAYLPNMQSIVRARAAPMHSAKPNASVGLSGVVGEAGFMRTNNNSRNLPIRLSVWRSIRLRSSITRAMTAATAKP